jgi:hypothetical protein
MGITRSHSEHEQKYRNRFSVRHSIRHVAHQTAMSPSINQRILLSVSQSVSSNPSLRCHSAKSPTSKYFNKSVTCSATVRSQIVMAVSLSALFLSNVWPRPFKGDCLSLVRSQPSFLSSRVAFISTLKMEAPLHDAMFKTTVTFIVSNYWIYSVIHRVDNFKVD